MLKSRLSLIALAGIVFIYLAVGWLSLSTANFGENHDDGIYAVTGRSLAETGEFRIISLPGEPFERKYPVVFPAMLAVVWRIAGDFPANIVWLEGVSLLAGAVFLCLTYGFLRTVGAGGCTAAVIPGICAVLPATGALANSTMSELAYGAISMGALWLLERAVRVHPSPWLGLAAGGVAGLAFQTRTVGLTLMLAMIIVLSWRRRWRALAGGIVGAWVAVGFCGLWQGSASEVPPAYDYYVNYSGWFLRTAHDLGWRFAVVVPIKNLIFFVLSVVRTTLPEMYDLSGSVPKQFAVVMAAILVWSTLIYGWVRRRQETWAIYLLLYFALLMVWPFPPGPRFVVPVLPLILYGVWEGFQRVRPSARLIRVVATIVGVVVITAAVLDGDSRLRNAHVKPFLHRYEWIRRNTAPDDVIACVLDPNCYLYTGRKAVSILSIGDMALFYGPQVNFHIRPEKLAEMIRTSKASYIMVESNPKFPVMIEHARRAVKMMQQESPGQLEEVWHDESEESTIYRVRELKSAKGTPLSLR
jgi:hypothetical protein